MPKSRKINGEFNNKVAELLRRRQAESGMTRTELANVAGLHVVEMTQLLNGDRAITIEELLVIADILGLDASELMKG